jgi:hypothetical protein
MIKLSKYHPNWQENRIKYILSLYDKDFFKGKTILELGPYNGFIGSYFQSIGSHVTSIEGRLENVENIKKDYPNIENIIHYNLDTDKWEWGNFDIIINFGLYYHLHNFHKEHLTNCINNCNIMFFESVIYDSDISEIYFREEVGEDQSLSGMGGTPTLKYIENIFIKNDIDYEIHDSSNLNGDNHLYDWESVNDKKLLDNCRRLFITKNKQLL